MNYDALIVGAGVAGAACALGLAQSGRRAVLLDDPAAEDRLPPRKDWISARALALLDELGVEARDCAGEPFPAAVFHSPDLKRSARSASDDPPAYRIDETRLIKRLLSRAVKSGVRLVEGPPSVEVTEHGVAASVQKGERVEARFLVLADATVTSAPLVLDSRRCCVQLVCPMKSKCDDRDLHWVLGLEGGQALLAWWIDGSELVIRWDAPRAQGPAARIVTQGPSRSTDARRARGPAARIVTHGPSCPTDAPRARGPADTRLTAHLEALASRKLLPEQVRGAAGGQDWPAPASSALRRSYSRSAPWCQEWPAPASSALEIDSHVAKRTLRIGDAGGFYAVASRERIYPCLWSAGLAVKVLHPAADSAEPQDELRQFSTLWRTTMAEYLRPPNTDLQFLLPMIFTNPHMTDRLAAAFWHGENI